MFQPPDKQPPKGWKLKLAETKGTVEGADFLLFCKAANEQLSSNNFPVLTPEQLLERVRNAAT